jgi:hypothetical protein
MLGSGEVRMVGGENEAKVGVLVRRLAIVRRHRYHHNVLEIAGRPWSKVGEPCLLRTLAKRHRQRIVFAGIGVPADLQPGLLPIVPSQQHLSAWWVDDERRRRDMQWRRTVPRSAVGDQRDHPLDIPRFDVGTRSEPSQA